MILLRNSKSKIRNYFILIFAFFAFSFNFTFAYTETTEGGNLLAEVFPENPGSFTNTTISLISYGVNLDKSDIVWTVNGEKIREGIGQKSLEIKTGDVGKKISIDISVISPDGISISKNISIIPAEVDVVWQAKGYTPPFYKGKTLAGQNNAVTFLAIPNFIGEDGLKIDPSKLFYSWRTESADIDSGVGKNKKIIVLDGRSYQTNVFLEISDLNETIKASKLIEFIPQTPKILIYEDGPLLGPNYNQALGDIFEMKDTEATIRAEPYFFNNQPGTLKPTYSWSLNGVEALSVNNQPNTLTLRSPRGGAGVSILNLLVESFGLSINKSLQVKFNLNSFNF